ncbi:hypothetical protein CRG98_016877 [Punica granatum]|uniref:Uncharacterized protein n=1 Tax=Punica granatum TaxID=22663 RepID=A0A2I0K2G2_PUNGR|nr:hypothetical protein CRG98_016877 [Punica granatum]
MARMGFHECSGTRACTFGELGARGVRLECTGGARAHGQARGARGRVGVHAGRAAGAGSRAGARLCAWGVRRRAGWHTAGTVHSRCSGARASTFGDLGARGVRLECTGGARAHGQARGPAGRRADVQACAGARAGARRARARGLACGCAREACAGARAGARLAHG